MIGKKFKELREEKKLLQKDVAKYLNISTSAYGYYEQGKRNPDIETIKKLADFFDVSADYLLGRTNNKRGCIDYRNNLYNNEKYTSFKETDEKIIEKLLNEGIIAEGEPVPQVVFDKILIYGLETAIEILKLEKKLE